MGIASSGNSSMFFKSTGNFAEIGDRILAKDIIEKRILKISSPFFFNIRIDIQKPPAASKHAIKLTPISTGVLIILEKSGMPS